MQSGSQTSTFVLSSASLTLSTASIPIILQPGSNQPVQVTSSLSIFLMFFLAFSWLAKISGSLIANSISSAPGFPLQLAPGSNQLQIGSASASTTISTPPKSDGTIGTAMFIQGQAVVGNVGGSLVIDAGSGTAGAGSLLLGTSLGQTGSVTPFSFTLFLLFYFLTSPFSYRLHWDKQQQISLSPLPRCLHLWSAFSSLLYSPIVLLSLLYWGPIVLSSWALPTLLFLR